MKRRTFERRQRPVAESQLKRKPRGAPIAKFNMRNLCGGKTMLIRLLLLLGIGAAILITSMDTAFAAGGDASTETEDLSDESDAAAAEVKEVKERVRQEKAEATANHNAAKRERDAAVAAKNAALERLNQSEAEIQRLNKEAIRLKSETDRLNGETALHEKAIAENNAKAEKAGGEIKALQDLRGEAAKRFIETGIQREKIENSNKSLDTQIADAKRELQMAKDQEKQASAQLEKMRTEHAANKAKTEQFLAQMRDQYKEAQARASKMKAEMAQIEQTEQKLATQAKAAEAEVKDAEARADGRSLSSVATAGDQPAAMTFKRTCKVFEGPKRGAKVLAVHESGKSIKKSDEGQKWIAFKMDDGRKGFAAKACFR